MATDTEVSRAVAQVDMQERIAQIERELLGIAPGEDHVPPSFAVRIACDVLIALALIVAVGILWASAQGWLS